MHFNVARGDTLRPWLVSTLEPICDADPVVLADYVIALLRHDGEEQQLRELFASQLEDFLDQEAPAFVDKLFKEMSTRGMVVRQNTAPSIPASAPSQPVAGPSNPALPQSLPTPPDDGIPIPLDMFSGPASDNNQIGQKRGRDSDDMDIDRGPPKGPRLENGLQGIQRYESRNQNGPGSFVPTQPGNWRGQGPRGRGRGGRGGRGGGPPSGPSGRDRREPCRDFHDRGYCARGMMCPFSHGDNMPMVPPMMPFFMPGMMPPMPGLPMPMPMPGPNGQMQFPIMPNMFSVANPPDVAQRQDGEYDPSQAQMPVSPGGMGIMGGTSMTGSSEDQDMESADGAGRGRGRGGFRGRGLGRIRVGHEGGRGFRLSPDDKTLLIEKIPSEHLSLTAINEQLKKHGTITNIAIDARGAKAIVSFATHDEAQRAHRDPEPVFGSRFVKLLWHRPLEGRGALGQEMLEKSKVLMDNINQPKPPAPTRAPIMAKPKPAQSAQDAHAAALTVRSQLLDKHIAEQKNLMSSLEKATTPAEKKKIMLLLKQNDQKMKEIKDAPLPAAAPAPVAVSATGASRDAQLKERLDRELDLQSAMEDVKENGEGNPELLAQLAQLREEARNAGVPLDANGQPIDQPAPTYTPGYSRPYVRGRGRGRGRGGWRGGPPVYHQSMKLDLRPKKLVIKGVAAGNEDALSAVRNFYVASGGMESLEPQPDGTIHVSFFSRAAAESAMSKGSSIPSAGSVSVAWQASSAPPTSSQRASSTGGSEANLPQGTQESQEMEQHLAGTQESEPAGDDDPWATSHEIVVDE
ncbi:hypothetical protein DACRYDRAFT_101554 [Dacryopinax primogenitus]|uniref:C3H1-type domain-containing protein n=1 Tax=Dacryopinax primogenitus (strain DJM 731) TaxID=1858805 RepID=M5FZD4_DACPD|nr:uncharacterized protein DACRYDRAFT_101554 [Dacryopinax primogenitus]EJT98931.1 hypothetical protein DACRYDRAFT_101554 [Dacryopinax primogenitus]